MIAAWAGMALALLVMFGVAWPVLAQHVVFQDGFESVIVPDPDNNPPVITSTAVTVATVGHAYGYTVTATDADNDPLTFSLTIAPAGMTIGAATGAISWTPDEPGNIAVTVQVADGRGGFDSQTYVVAVSSDDGGDPGGIPPDPADVSPEIDPTVATHIATSTEFLYSGQNRIQYGVPVGAIEPARVGILRGRVLTRNGAPLALVQISIKNHPEFGYTRSRADGAFDLAVNGGGSLTIDYELEGFLPAQRTVRVPWQDFVHAPDVALVGLDPNVTSINLAALTEVATVRGSVEEDVDGRRQATMLFKPGTTAELVMPNGSSTSISALSVRATEYTVGPQGPAAMPGELPLNSGYTYAVELSADEAMAAGATRVRFDRPLAYYIENFPDFPVGGIVPSGYYDRQESTWIASQNGIVIGLVGVDGDLAEIDIDGSGTAGTAEALAALGIDEAERRRLAELYDPGQSLWRIEIDHFTPYDYNWPFGPPDDATAPNQPTPRGGSRLNDPCERTGSIIECENQTLGERLGVTGTPFSLNYRSDRTPGRIAVHPVRIPLSGSSVPGSLKRIELSVSIAGQEHRFSFMAEPGLEKVFTWDQRDAYGRRVQGGQLLTATIGYVYDGESREPADVRASFGRFGGARVTGNRQREVIISQTFTLLVGALDARAQGLAGWVVDGHHAYDPTTKTIYLSSGEQRSAQDIAFVMRTAAGVGDGGAGGDGGPATDAELADPWGMVFDPAGNLYVSQPGFHVVRKIDTNGIISTVAGTSVRGFSGDGGPATEARLRLPMGLALGPDGSLFIADSGNHRIRRITPDGIIATIAGDGSTVLKGDDGPATDASLWEPYGITISPEGHLYIADWGHTIIRRVDPGGIITTFAGNGTAAYNGDGRPATTAGLFRPSDVAIGPGGDVYIADTGNRRIRRVGPDGMIATVGLAGATNCESPELFLLCSPIGIAFGNDARLYVADSYYDRVMRMEPDGSLTPVAGVFTGEIGFGGDGGPATQAQLWQPEYIAFSPVGVLHIADVLNDRVRRVEPTLPGFSLGTTVIASEDGSELYEFESNGRHRRTVDALTGVARYTFAYDAAGRLARITDSDGLATIIERDQAGNPTAMVGPYGQRTTLVTDASGWLTQVTNPAGEAVQFTYGQGGLLTIVTDPTGNTASYSYDALGRLVSARDQAGHQSTLSLQETLQTSTVTLTTPMGRATVYHVESLPHGAVMRTITSTSGATTSLTRSADDVLKFTYPDGTQETVRRAADPRFNLQAPMDAEVTVESPSGRTATMTETREAEYTDPADLTRLTRLRNTIEFGERRFTREFDRDALTITDTSATGHRKIRLTDDVGRTLEVVSDPALDAHRYEYDLLGQLLVASLGELRYTFTHDAHGRIASQTNAAGHTTYYTRDSVGRVLSVQRPNGAIIEYEHDVWNRVRAMTMPSGHVHEFAFTPVGLESLYQPPGNPPVAREFNPDAQLTLTTLPSGRRITRDYLDDGRIAGFQYPEASVNFNWLDATLRPAALEWMPADGPSQMISFAYDGALVTSMSFSGAAIGAYTYDYDDDFQLVDMTLNAGSGLSFTYDHDGRPTSIGTFLLERSGPAGRVGSMTDGMLGVEYDYAPTGLLSMRSLAISGNPVYELQIEHANTGRVARRTETEEAGSSENEYAYDANGQLTEVRQNGMPLEHYAYDLNGNRVSKEVAGIVSLATYDEQDRLIALAGTPYEFDDDGFLVGRGDDVFSYSARGELLEATLDTGEVITYVYDALGRRVARSDDTSTEYYLYGNPNDPFQVTAARDPGGELATLTYDDGGLLIAMVRAGVRYYIATDQVGTPRIVINDAGDTVRRMLYDSWGQVFEDSNPDFWLPISFAGGLVDSATGLVRMGLRDYEPAAGRWMAKDPILFGGGQWNLYAYADSDPIGMRDPSGLFCIGFGAYGVVGGKLKLCIDSEGVGFCGEVGLGFGGGLEADLVAPIPSQADATFVTAEIAARCFGAGLGFGARLNACGDLEPRCKAGIGILDLCRKRVKLADVGVFDGANEITGKGNSPRVGNFLDKADSKLKRFGAEPKCKIEGKIAAGGCWSSNL